MQWTPKDKLIVRQVAAKIVAESKQFEDVTHADAFDAAEAWYKWIMFNERPSIEVDEPQGDCNGCGSDHDPHECPKL